MPQSATRASEVIGRKRRREEEYINNDQASAFRRAASRAREQSDANPGNGYFVNQRRTSESRKVTQQLRPSASGAELNERRHVPLPRRRLRLPSKAQGKRFVPQRSGATSIEDAVLDNLVQEEPADDYVPEPQAKRTRLTPNGLPLLPLTPTTPGSVRPRSASSLFRSTHGSPSQNEFDPEEDPEGSGFILRPHHKAPNQTFRRRDPDLQQLMAPTGPASVRR